MRRRTVGWIRLSLLPRLPRQLHDNAASAAFLFHRRHLIADNTLRCRQHEVLQIVHPFHGSDGAPDRAALAKLPAPRTLTNSRGQTPLSPLPLNQKQSERRASKIVRGLHFGEENEAENEFPHWLVEAEALLSPSSGTPPRARRAMPASKSLSCPAVPSCVEET